MVDVAAPGPHCFATSPSAATALDARLSPSTSPRLLRTMSSGVSYRHHATPSSSSSGSTPSASALQLYHPAMTGASHDSLSGTYTPRDYFSCASAGSSLAPSASADPSQSASCSPSSSSSTPLSHAPSTSLHTSFQAPSPSAGQTSSSVPFSKAGLEDASRGLTLNSSSPTSMASPAPPGASAGPELALSQVTADESPNQNGHSFRYDSSSAAILDPRRTGALEGRDVAGQSNSQPLSPSESGYATPSQHASVDAVRSDMAVVGLITSSPIKARAVSLGSPARAGVVDLPRTVPRMTIRQRRAPSAGFTIGCSNDEDSDDGEHVQSNHGSHQPSAPTQPRKYMQEDDDDNDTTQPLRSPYRLPNGSQSEPSLTLQLPGSSFQMDPFLPSRPGSSSRLPLTPLEEVHTPSIAFDSPTDLSDFSHDPFNKIVTGADTSDASQQSKLPQTNETFYHALLEVVRTEDGYEQDLADLVEVHFSLLSFASFVTEEQRNIIIRDAARLLELHRRLQTKLRRVNEDLGWIRDDEADVSETHSPFSTERRRFKSSDATVAEAARRISAIFLHETDNLCELYKPFCSTHTEAMEIVKHLSLQRLDWDAYEAQCTSKLAFRKSASTRLHLADFLIKPIQRICRYPLLFNALLKHVPEHHAPECLEKIQEVHDALKKVAAEVDTAQRQRFLEIATVKLAMRMDVQNSDVAHLLNQLDRALLIGSGHVIHTDLSQAAHTSTSSMKVEFFGLVLYTSHLVMLKAKKTNLYEPKHWIPLRLFDLSKVPDGDGMLPYAVRLSFSDHVFEIGSLCHQEQDIWFTAIESAIYACKQKWIESIASNPIMPIYLDHALFCSEKIEPECSIIPAASPTLSEVASCTGSPEITLTSASGFTSGASVVSQSPPTHEACLPALRPRLSLKPPAQRVAVDLRLADLLCEDIMSARAQSKRSHAMPLHGPPPRLMSQPASGRKSLSTRPLSFHSAGLTYKSLIENAKPSRRTSTDTETGRPSLRHILTNTSIASSSGTLTSAQSYTDTTKPSKLRRSKTSVQLVNDGEQAKNHQATRSLSALSSKIRRRTTSSYPAQAPQKLIEDLREMAREDAPVTNADASAQQAGVARNSSTSSSSSYGSNSTDLLHTSVETPQSSLPASPLISPIDLETRDRWSKLSETLANTLSRKRSFVTSRPHLAIPPEPLLHGLQLQQAQAAAEYIYGNVSAAASPQDGPRGSRFSAPVTVGMSPMSNKHERRSSWDPSSWNASHRIDGGHSTPNLTLAQNKRQGSSQSLWSVYGTQPGTPATGSPAPSIYESAVEEEEEESVSAASSKPVSPVSAPSALPSMRTPLASAPSPVTQAVKTASLSPPQADADRPGTILKRKNTLSARIRAFRALGSSMTPMSNPTGASTRRP